MLEDMHHFLEELERSYSRKLLYTPSADFENITNIIRNSIYNDNVSNVSGDSFYGNIGDEFMWNSSIKLALSFFSFPIKVRIVESQIGHTQIPLLNIYRNQSFPLFLMKGFCRDIIKEGIDNLLIKRTSSDWGEYWAYLGRILDGITSFYWERKCFNSLFLKDKKYDFRSILLEIFIKFSEFAIYYVYPDNPIIQQLLPPLLLTPFESLQRRIMWGDCGNIFYCVYDIDGNNENTIQKRITSDNPNFSTCPGDRTINIKESIITNVINLYHGLPTKLSLNLLNIFLRSALNYGKSLDEEGYFRNSKLT